MPCVFPVRYVSDGLAVQTTSRDVNLIGIEVRSLQPPPVGSRVSMALYLPNAPAPEVAIGHVARGSEGAFWADFMVLDPVARMRIGKMLSDGAEEQRVFKRHAIELTVHFRTAREFAQQHATNLSRGGIFIRCAEPPRVNTPVEVHFELPNGVKLETRGVVVHHAKDGVGVQFVDAGDEFRAELDRYMHSLA